MKSQPNALTPAAVAATAGKKTVKVQRKLKVAEAELHHSNEILVKALPEASPGDLAAALRQNLDAEGKVREAAQELEAVAELLSHGEGGEPPAARSEHLKNGKSGEGAHSVIEHLPKRGG